MKCIISVLMAGSMWFGTIVLAASDDILTPLDLRQIKVGGEIGRRIDITVNNNLLKLDVDRDFFPRFRAKASHIDYVGLGKLIDAAVRLAAYTQNEKAIALKKYLIEETITTQDPDGYIGIMAPEYRMSALWDVHEMGYIILGLISDYHFFQDKRSLEAACKLADYLLGHWPQLPPNWPEAIGNSSIMGGTGLEHNLLSLYHETGDRRYLDFCIHERGLKEWDLGIVTGRRRLIEGHAYTYLARCLAQLDLYRLDPQPNLLIPTQRAIDFLTAQDGMTITGATGQYECWTDDQDGRNYLGETCATTYQLRLYDSLLRLKGDSFYGDLIERTIYNALFAAQSTDGRQIRYFAPFEDRRVYWSKDYYCCPGNYRRIVADLPTMVYYRSPANKGLSVNLYTPSEAIVELDGGTVLRVRQETDYPTSGCVVLRLDPSQSKTFPLSLRIPRWCNHANVFVNGKPWNQPIPSGDFLTIEREWNAGDQVNLEMPMPWRLVQGRKRQAGRAAIMRGPIVFCLNPANNKSLKEREAPDPAEPEPVEDRDGADLGFITLDPTSLKAIPDDSVRPNGIAGEGTAGDEPWATGSSDNLLLRLTEFPDPQGKCIYFRLPDLGVAVPDELLPGGRRESYRQASQDEQEEP